MSDRRYLSCSETAKLLRATLRAEFPGVKFSVRSSTYAGGASINVTWTDGPVSDDVKVVCDLFSGATFDGMIDLKSYHSSLLSTADGFEEVSFGADYVFATRELSDEFTAKLLGEIAAAAGVESVTFNDDVDVAVYEGRAISCSGLQHYQRHVGQILYQLSKTRPLAVA